MKAERYNGREKVIYVEYLLLKIQVFPAQVRYLTESTEYASTDSDHCEPIDLRGGLGSGDRDPVAQPLYVTQSSSPGIFPLDTVQSKGRYEWFPQVSRLIC